MLPRTLSVLLSLRSSWGRAYLSSRGERTGMVVAVSVGERILEKDVG